MFLGLFSSHYFGIACMKSTMEIGMACCPPFPDVHIEAMEEAENTRDELKENWACGMAAPKREHAKRLLAVAQRGIPTHTITNKRLAQAGYYSILDWYESLHSCG